MRLGASLFLASLALAGCGGAPSKDGGTLQEQEQEQARTSELEKLGKWERAFQPDVAVPAANQFGFRAPAYGPAKQGFASIGAPVMVSDSAAKAPNRAGFAATGASADTIDTLAFDLALTDPNDAKRAHSRFADIVRDFLFQSKIDGKALHAAIVKGEPAKGKLDGTDYAIEKAADRLTVTFHRTGASAPANS